MHTWQVIGLNNVPLAGDEFEVVGSLDIAREMAESREESLRNERITEKAGDGKITLSSLASAVSSGKTAGLDLHQLNIILKVDVQVISLYLTGSLFCLLQHHSVAWLCIVCNHQMFDTSTHKLCPTRSM